MRRKTSTRRLAWVAALAVASTAASAAAEQVYYSTSHPIPRVVAGDFCYIEVPHVHVYQPDQPELLYRINDGQFGFVGDPVPFGYQGPRYSYYGPHPVTVNTSVDVYVPDPAVEFCYLNGPHYHLSPPPANFRYTLRGGVYWYMGAYPRTFYQGRKALVRVNAIYDDFTYDRPVVAVAAPVGYVGPVVRVSAGPPGPPPGPPPGAGIGVGASVEVNIPVPTVDVQIGAPGVIVVDRPPRRRGHWKHKKYKQWDDD